MTDPNEETGLELSEPEASEDHAFATQEISEAERLEIEVQQARDLLRRKQAEFENYRKRVEREREGVVAYAAAELVKELLPVLDNLERALDASEGATVDRFREGVEIIYRQFRDVLIRSGMKEVEAVGHPFDPYVHEAVSRVESSEQPDGTVVEVLQKGYYLKDRLLRPALVSVVQSSFEGGSADSDDRDREEGSSDAGKTVPSDAPSS